MSDAAIATANALKSPCLQAGSAHEVILVKNCPSAADGLNLGLERARNDWVVCMHQDVYLQYAPWTPSTLPADDTPPPPTDPSAGRLPWDQALARQLLLAEDRFGPIGVAGVYGVGPAVEAAASPLSAERIGWVVDRGRTLRDGPELPARVAALDELLLVVRRDTPLRFDRDLEFHLYGADLCLQAAERGLAVVALGASCHHNSRSVGLPKSFFASAEVFARKWSRRLPVATPCVIIDRGGQVRLLGNAGEGSIAYAGPAEPRSLSAAGVRG